jgi:hypothetical protein
MKAMWAKRKKAAKKTAQSLAAAFLLSTNGDRDNLKYHLHCTTTAKRVEQPVDSIPGRRKTGPAVAFR